MHTSVPSLGQNVGDGLGVVRQVLSEELCPKNNVFPGVRGRELGTKKFGFSGETQSGTLVGVL